ncbi:hypothetical protein D3C76_1186570 [compost metagenome]
MCTMASSEPMANSFHSVAATLAGTPTTCLPLRSSANAMFPASSMKATLYNSSTPTALVFIRPTCRSGMAATPWSSILNGE